MADQTQTDTQASVSLKSLMEERQSFWSSFTGAVTIAAAAVAALVVALAIFLV